MKPEPKIWDREAAFSLVLLQPGLEDLDHAVFTDLVSRIAQALADERHRCIVGLTRLLADPWVIAQEGKR